MYKVIVFGMGRIYKNNKYKIMNVKSIEIVGYIDNDKALQGTKVDKKDVFAPEKILQLEYDCIIIMSTYSAEMTMQLLSLGVEKNKICEFRNLDLFFDNYFMTDNFNKAQLAKVHEVLNCSYKSEKIIAMYTSEILLAGGAIVFLYLVRAFKELGYYPIVISIHDGVLKHEFDNLDIPILISGFTGSVEKQIVENSAVVIINTFQCYPIISIIPQNKKIYWWIHEPSEFYSPNAPSFSGDDYKNLKVLAVSEIAKRNFLEYNQFEDVDILHYGIPDSRSEKKYTNKLVFAIVGNIYKRKGHDIFLEAIKNLNCDELEQCEFYVVGKNSDNEIYEQLEQFSNKKIILTGELPLKEVEEIRRNIDVLICCSREDPFPTVVTEAMMSGITVLGSSEIGNAKYITDGYNGFIYGKAEEFDKLTEKVRWIIKNRGKITTIGENARATYEKYFTIEALKANIKQVF